MFLSFLRFPIQKLLLFFRPLVSKSSPVICFTVLSIFIFPEIIFTQTIYETDNLQIYTFLNRLDQKQLININEEVTPYSKKFITEKLVELKAKGELLNNLEQKELSWYLKKYSLERNLNGHILAEWNYIEKEFRTRIFPIAGYGISAVGGKIGFTKKVGLHFDAYYSNHFGVSFEYLDTGEFGDNVDKRKFNSPRTGHFIKGAPDGIEFSDVRGQLNYNWSWGSFSLKKDYNQWGHGKFGRLILSHKAASYPQIELRLHPVKWIDFYYMHGWLNSLVIDSSKSFYYGSSNIQPRLFQEYKSKYIVANLLSIHPNNRLNFSVGNSFVYSGDLRPEMFLPFMYYKVMDHNTGRGDIGDGNGMIYFDAAVKYPDKFKFYSTLLIDVLDIRDLLSGKAYTSWLGYTIGASAVDLVLNNFDLTIEYTKTNPWLYENKYDITNYKHLNYSLGHWIGQNADLLSMELEYSLMRGLHFTLLGQIFRKGGLKDIYIAYHNPPDLPFLFSPKRIEKSFTFRFYYEPYYNLYLQGEYRYSDITDEESGRTQNFLLGRKNSFFLALSYGIPY